MHLNEIIKKFNNAKQINENSYMVQCSAHVDDKASLTITEKDNKILMHCHAGCSLESILSSVGLTEKDLFNNEIQEKPKIVAEYIYTNSENKPLYKVIRYCPKSFVQAKYDNGKWIYKMTNVEYVPYNLPNVVKNNEIYFVEGEKDVDNLNKIGLIATTTVGGAASFKKKAEIYAQYFKDKIVYIIPDNDKPGYKYAEDIKNSLNDIAKDIKILKLSDSIKDLKDKEDISDVIEKYGKEKTLEILKELKTQKDIVNIENKELTRDYVFSITTFKKLYELELNDLKGFFEFYNELKGFCDEKRITGFDKSYKLYKESTKEKPFDKPNTMLFPDLNDIAYNSGRYTINSDGNIHESIPDIGEILVCYHPILPIEKYKNIEDGLEKIKLAFYVNDEWRKIIVEKSTIASTQNIIKLSDIGIAVTSENAKFLVRYLSEIENLNRDKIKVNTSVSKMGWANGVLMPYSNEIEFDNEIAISNIQEKFGEKGNLQDWIEFFKEKRKKNPISRIIMASSVASILLKDIKQNGFTVHIWGTSEYGKSVSCMVAQSIFGNPANDSNGIGINFNFTSAGLEYRLNLYNNIPLFINEMQHQKDAKDYDKILFLISEGSGKSRSTKNGGIGKENSWNNVVITNGEKNIIKDNSNAGAYNRCLSCETTDYTYDDLPEVADFVRDNYGTVIREILNHLKEYNCKEIYKGFLAQLKDQDTTNKQKIIEAIILTGDKILTDIIFKDNYYLEIKDFEDNTIKKKEVAIEERAYYFIRDWYETEKRHFLSKDLDSLNNEDIKVDIYGRDMQNGYIAIIPSNLKNALENNGFDYNEVLNAWKRNNYIKHEKNRNSLTVRINNSRLRCIVLDLLKDIEEENNEEQMELPF